MGKYLAESSRELLRGQTDETIFMPKVPISLEKLAELNLELDEKDRERFEQAVYDDYKDSMIKAAKEGRIV